MRSFKNYFKQCGQLQLVKKFQSLAFLLILPAIGFAQTDRLSKPKLVDSGDVVKVSTTSKDSIMAKLNEILNKTAGKEIIGHLKLRETAVSFPRDFSPISLASKDSIKAQVLASYANKVLGKTFITARITTKPLFKHGDPITTGEVDIRMSTIDSAKITITEGIIEHLRVFTKDGRIYVNTKAPISLLNLEGRFNDRLFSSREGSYLYLKDVLDFDSERRFNYFPDDSSFTLKNKENIKILVADNGINSLINISLYSDLLALFGNTPNGLIQAEASAKFYLHRHNYPNHFIYAPLDAVNVFFHFNRIDSKFDTIRLAPNGVIDRLELFQRSTYTVGADVNIFKWDWRPSNTMEIKAGYFLSSGTLNLDSIDRNYTLHNPFAELALRSKKLNNFGLDIRYRQIFQKLNKNAVFEGTGWNPIGSIRATVYYFTGKKSDSKIFLRFVNYLNYNDRNKDFNLLQFGTQIPLKL